MTAQTATLTDFLLARIAEDEEVARFFDGVKEAHYETRGLEASPEYVTLYVSPARVLAECEAKRRIVEHCEVDHLAASPGDPYVLQLLALPYADHEEFQEAWRA